MLVSLQSDMEHLSRLFALLGHQLGRDGQQSGEASLDNLVKVGSVLPIAGLEAVGAADSQEALQAGEDRTRVVGVQELDSEVHKSRPFLGEVPVQNSLQDGDKLLSNEAGGGGQDGQ